MKLWHTCNGSSLRAPTRSMTFVFSLVFLNYFNEAIIGKEGEGEATLVRFYKGYELVGIF